MESKKRTLLIKLVLGLFALSCVVPIILIISISFTDEKELFINGFSLIPRKFSTGGYAIIFENPKQLLQSYATTTIVTLVGTVLSMTVTSMLAYTMSRKDFFLSRHISFYVFFTMLFSGGLVPWYILVSRTLGLKDSILALIVPYLIVPWFVMLMKGFFSSIPMSIIESAKIDGAREFSIFLRIVLPLSTAGIATVSLFCILNYWNDYWLSLMFIEGTNHISLQFLLYRIMSNIEFLNSSLAVQSGLTGGVTSIPSLSSRMAMCILAAGPMLFVFPFFQKFFVRGITVGSIKG